MSSWGRTRWGRTSHGAKLVSFPPFDAKIHVCSDICPLRARSDFQEHSSNFHLHTWLEISYKEKCTKLKKSNAFACSGCHNHEFPEKFEIPALFNSSTTFNNTQSHPVHLQLKIRYSKSHDSVWMASVLIIKVSTSAVRKKATKTDIFTL